MVTLHEPSVKANRPPPLLVPVIVVLLGAPAEQALENLGHRFAVNRPD